MTSYDEHLISMAGGDGELDLDAIQARADAATEGPWHVDGFHDVVRPGLPTDYVDTAGIIQDAKFIAAARSDVPALLALVREQAAKLEAVEQWTAKFEASQSSDIAKRENAQFDLGYSAGRRAAGSILRTSLTATEGAA